MLRSRTFSSVQTLKSDESLVAHAQFIQIPIACYMWH